jgi:molybdopterin-containing oxidoreductase family iron-sulfur binding subunit
MNRLYVVESHMSVTGLSADHRYTLGGTKTPDALVALGYLLQKKGISLSEFSNLWVSQNAPETLFASEPRFVTWLNALADDLVQQGGVVVVGYRQGSEVHALGLAINRALGGFPKYAKVFPRPEPQGGFTPREAFTTTLNAGRIETLVVLGGDPVATSPQFQTPFSQIPQSFYLGDYPQSATAKVCAGYFPAAHFLESWGDTVDTSGTVRIQQPLIAPLFPEALDVLSVVGFLYANKLTPSHDLVKNAWQQQIGGVDFESIWRTALGQGVLPQGQVSAVSPSSASRWAEGFQKSLLNRKPLQPSEQNFVLEFALSPNVYDGRYANNAWLQELPDPVQKTVWDNALLISPKTARMLGVLGKPPAGSADVDVLRLTLGGQTIEVPVWETPGVADFTGVLHVGYGQPLGRVSQGVGVNVDVLRAQAPWFLDGLRYELSGKKYEIVSTQEHASLNGTPGVEQDRPPVVRMTSLDEYRKDPSYVLKNELLPIAKQKSNLFDFPQDPSQAKWARQQWGMTIDLSTCTGCQACVVACQSENNISVVGKDQIFRQREMSWIRIDRYFTGSVDDPEVQGVVQPLNCLHCENAPCEAVCPVAATVHSPDGLNDMVYNRCIGTRYCANNCPYKVRRFNFFNYSKIDDERNPLYAMQKNPNVTVRFRGVMEKCTYCVQRINGARSKAGLGDGTGLVADGGIITACQSACPTGAIVFGDIADPKTLVSQRKAQGRNYALLGEINTKPRTTYLGKIRNVNPRLG